MTKRAKLTFCIISILILGLMTGCGTKGSTTGGSVGGSPAKTEDIAKVNLMENASPETSALAFYNYDGKQITRSFIYDQDIIKKILEDFNTEDVEFVDEEDKDGIKVEEPFYALEMSDKEGHDLSLSWSNGYVYKADGSMYRFDYDFEKLSKDYEWQDEDKFDSLTVFPNNAVMALDINENKWDKNILTKAKKNEPPKGITMTLTDFDSEAKKFKAKFYNDSGSEWEFGNYFQINVYLDNEWYEVPASLDGYAVEDIANILKHGQDTEMEFDISMFGELPSGQYRFAIEGMTDSFAVSGDGSIDINEPGEGEKSSEEVTQAARDYIRADSNKSILNWDNPDVQEFQNIENALSMSSYSSPMIINEDYSKEGYVYIVTFKTKDDAVLGPIVLFLDKDCTVFAQVLRE